MHADLDRLLDRCAQTDRAATVPTDPELFERARALATTLAGGDLGWLRSLWPCVRRALEYVMASAAAM